MLTGRVVPCSSYERKRRPVERQSQRDLEILAAIGEGQALSQRALAQRLGVALGLTNLLLKRLAKKGYIKIVEFPTKPAARARFRYLLTPKGIQEKMRLTYDHAAYSLVLYRRARQTLRDSLALLSRTGLKRVALCGTGEAAELAYLTLKEFGLEPVGVRVEQARAATAAEARGLAVVVSALGAVHA